LNFSQAINKVRRDNMLHTVHDELPELYKFGHMCLHLYSTSATIYYCSDEGAQQGDPLNPLLFCAASLKLACSKSSEFNLWYLDDDSVGGSVDSLLHDPETVKRVGLTIGFELNDIM
jgi:hypothetical protein